jgi:hypothetical protein
MRCRRVADDLADIGLVIDSALLHWHGMPAPHWQPDSPD